MASQEGDLHAESYFDWVEALLIPAKFAVIAIFMGGIVSNGTFRYWEVISGFFLAFIVVIVVPLFLFVSYINQPEVFISGDTIRIAPQSGLVNGWSFPIRSIPWKQADHQLVIYPFNFFIFVMSAGIKPFRVRLKVPPAEIHRWIATLQQA